ncbi:MAG: DNA repair protein RecN [Oscillospiraceae bacterium]|nr:DNA repair protein RecN [Oscillospiraceae bacterium]MDY3065844.1 DNA repair protein RecN [Oscillospiraceae bacterium]
MLAELFIENLAVIEKTSIRLNTGLNVFTGETGAGKSIVIDAVGAVLGRRVSREMVRHGTDKAFISARFTALSDAVLQKITQAGMEPEEGALIVSREIFADGKSAARMMGRPVTAAFLREVGDLLINIHGQHENQVLLAPERHLPILDSYGDHADLLVRYEACYRKVLSLKREIRRLTVDGQEKARRIAELSEQAQEIEDAALLPDEEAQLTVRRAEYRNAAKIAETLQRAYQLLEGEEGEGGALSLTQSAAQYCGYAAEYSPRAGELFDRLDAAAVELDSVKDVLDSLLEEMQFDPAQLEQIENRIDLIRRLKHKYGGTEEIVIKSGEQARAALAQIELSDERLSELNAEAAKIYPQLLRLAEELTAARKKAAGHFAENVGEELRFLDMPNVKLSVSMEEGKPGPHGRDSVKFLISTNIGEPPKPIARIASGGELSRMMLAVKNTLAERDEIPTMIFDEIDTGVSGRAAQKIGLKLKQAARHRQVLAVTHSAQVAALADTQYLIRKENDGKRTFTNVFPLDEEARIDEVARIMSTDRITDLMRETARQMIEAGKDGRDNLSK